MTIDQIINTIRETKEMLIKPVELEGRGEQRKAVYYEHKIDEYVKRLREAADMLDSMVINKGAGR